VEVVVCPGFSVRVRYTLKARPFPSAIHTTLMKVSLAKGLNIVFIDEEPCHTIDLCMDAVGIVENDASFVLLSQTSAPTGP
jgi:hypothetical protein